jgi:antitoxin HicB
MSTIKQIKTVTPPYPFEAYARVITPLSKDDGGGYLITFPDLPGSISDGDTEEEALENGKDAFLTWVSATIDMGKQVPAPDWRPDTIPEIASGKFLTRVPKTVHARLIRKARTEGVSLNSLVLGFIAEGLGKKTAA